MNTNTYYNTKESTLGHISWRYYNKLKKKAMDQEFSIAGLVISLSIAFFIVISTALALSLAYNTIVSTQTEVEPASGNIYFLEESKTNYTLSEYTYSC